MRDTHMIDLVPAHGAESLGVSPLRGAGLLRCASSPPAVAVVSPLNGLPSLTRTRPGRRCRQESRQRPIPVPGERGP